jgi:hypothetical protein
MNKTLYVTDSDAPIWERAEKLAPSSLSALVTSMLREFVERHQPADGDGFERIEVQVQPTDESHVVKKAFTGRILVDQDEEFDGDSNMTYLVAQTKKGNLAVYSDNSRERISTLDVYDSFEHFEKETWPEDLIAAVAEGLKRPYVVELDI